MQSLADPTLLEPLPNQRQSPPSRHQRLHQLPHLLLHRQKVQGSHEENFQWERQRYHKERKGLEILLIIFLSFQV